MHHILLKEGMKPSREAQQRLNSNLKEVVKVLSSSGEALDHAEHQPQIAVDHFLARTLSLGGRAVAHFEKQFFFLFLAEHRQL